MDLLKNEIMCRTILLGLIVLMVTVGRVKADEGMWLPILLKRTEIRRDA